MEEKNILLQEWELPPFDRINTADFEPAIRAALAEAERNIEAIYANPEPATFANTIEALEVADARLNRVSAIMINLSECCTTDELHEAVMTLEPELAAFSTRVLTNRRLFERVQQVHTACEGSDALSPEQHTLLRNTYRSFVRHGVSLPDAEREEYGRNEEELSRLKVKFNKNVLDDTNSFTLHLTDPADLAGLPPSVSEAARQEAAERGLEGWAITLAAPSYVPFMTYSTRRDLRERLYRAYAGIGNRGDERDNNATIGRITRLRARQAQLLGYDTYCDYVLEDRMVQSLPNLHRFMQSMHEAVLPAAEADVRDLQALSPEPLQPWDVSHLSEQLRRQRYDFDSEALRPYFPLEAVRSGIFGLYGRLYGLSFEAAPEVPVYHADVQVFRVRRGDQPMGLLYLDMHPRASKRSGAWMTEFRGQHGSTRPQIQVVCNFSKPTADAPSLLRFSEVETFMHEMGHAMHGMLSEVNYESLSGTNVKRDFVEMPSQVMENWCYEPEFLSTFARHYQTGEPLPAEHIARIRAAQNHLAGWLCLRQLNLGLTDIAFHTMHPTDVPEPMHAEQVEAAAMTDLLPRHEGCCTATNFSHIFVGGYASGYYGYKWAEVLDADIFGRFKADGIFNAETAEAFRREVLSRGGTEQPALLFRRFMHRDPDPDALLRRMGIIGR